MIRYYLCALLMARNAFQDCKQLSNFPFTGPILSLIFQSTLFLIRLRMVTILHENSISNAAAAAGVFLWIEIDRVLFHAPGASTSSR